MNEDLTKKLSRTTDDTLTLIFMAVQDLTFRAGMIEHKLEDFAEKAELRLQKVDSDIAQLREGQQGLQEGQESLRSDLTAFRRDVDKQFMTLSGTVEGRYREHDQRITRLETNTNQANTQT
jgi:predicted  nucleic acid-binding Zn-ribbon protein